MSDGTLWELFARADDPETSKLAARRVDVSIKARHRWLLDWLRDRTATDDEMAAAMVAAAIVDRDEQGRRVARTLREQHGALAPVESWDGSQATRINRSGRLGLLWRLSEAGRVLLETSPDSALDSPVRCDRARSNAMTAPDQPGRWIATERGWFGPLDDSAVSSMLDRLAGNVDSLQVVEVASVEHIIY